MRSSSLSALGLSTLGLAVAALVAMAVPAAAESTVLLANGNKITGSVPPGETIRIQFDCAEGVEPRLTFSLTGSKIPISFNRTIIIGPDGETLLDTGRFFAQTRVRANKSTLKLRDFVAPATGRYQVVSETNSGNIVNLQLLGARGSFKTVRPSRLRIELDETNPVIAVPLLNRDVMSVKLKRISGDIPQVDRYVSPLANVDFPFTVKKITKKGDVSRRFTAVANATHSFEIGYRDGGTLGQFQATVKVTQNKVRRNVPMSLSNAPGIDISVRPADAERAVTFGIGEGGLAYDPITNSILVTAVQNGPTGPEIAGQLIDRDLFTRPGTPNAIPFVIPGDMQPGEQLGSHRIVESPGGYTILWLTASGSNVGLAYVRGQDLQRDGFVEVELNLQTPISDPFLATDGVNVSVGLPVPDGHDVRLYTFNSGFSLLGTIPIGGGPLTHGEGAGVAWNPDDSVFDLWAPDTSDFGLSSDLHRQGYSAVWQSQGPDQTPVADPGTDETLSTAVVYDRESGATIVHYIVPLDASGSGELHCVVIDSDGVVIPGSDTIVAASGRSRPAAILDPLGRSIYLVSATPTGPLVERFPLLR